MTGSISLPSSGCVVGERGRRLVHVRPQRRNLGVTCERPLAGQALVQHAAERVHVGARVDRFAADLLGRDVLDRAHQLTRAGQAGDRGRLLRQAEVRQVAVLTAGAPGDQDVGGLDVAMDEPALVGRVERVADLLDQPDRAIRVERRLAGDQLPEVVALDVPHRQVQPPVRLSCRVDRDDVRMIERRRDLRLAQEPLAEALALRELRRQELQRHLAAEADVFRAVDRSHAASPEQLLQTEAGDLAPGEWIRPDRQTRSFPALPKENTTVTEPLRLGDYSLELELGRGAVGVVHRGRSADGRVVAIKTFDPALAGRRHVPGPPGPRGSRGSRDRGPAPRADPPGR